MNPELSIHEKLTKLTARELDQFKRAANNGPPGGLELQGEIRAKAIHMELAYSSGRLRPLVYKMFRADTPLLVGANN